MVAARVSWDRSLRLEQSCRLCRRPDYADTRAAWGCDGQTQDPILHVRCWDCAPRPWTGCERCRGSGRVAVHECPRRIDHAAYEAVRSVDVAVELGQLPRAGGFDEQHPAWLDVFWLLMAERGRFEAEDLAKDRQRSTPQEPRHDPAPALDPYGYLRTPGG